MKAKIVLLVLLLISVTLFGCLESKTAGFPIITTDNNNDTNSVYNNLNNYKIAKSGDTVSVDYTLRDINGKLIESSVGKQPFTLVIDAGGAIKGFNDAIKGMKIGETKTVTIPPELAYGTVKQDMIQTYDKNMVPDFEKMDVSSVVYGGPYNYGVVIAKTDTNLTIDYNHKYAGDTLVFDITLISIN